MYTINDWRSCQDAEKMLRRLVLSGDDEGYDCHLQHHFLFLLGDLNYRVVGKRPEDVVTCIAESAAKEVRSNTLGGRNSKRFVAFS